MKTKRRNLILVAVLAVIGLACVIGGVSYALFNYYKKGTIENDVTTGKITFRYDETGVKGIDLQGATPILDKDGIELSNEGEYFDFTVSTKGTDKVIFYDIEAEMLADSTLPQDTVKLYLTEITDEKEKYAESGLKRACSIYNSTVRNYSDYEDGTEKNGKKICDGYFNATTEEKTRKYRLRAWIDKNADFSPEKNEDGTYKEDENGDYIYPYNNKSIKIRINVKASAGYETAAAVGDMMEPRCWTTSCTKGAKIKLPDNSEWLVAKEYDGNNDEFIYLLSTKYIDADSNYSDTPPYVSINGSEDERKETVLKNYSNKMSTILTNTNVVVSLPSIELLGLSSRTFDEDDVTFLYPDNLSFELYNGNYTLSDKVGYKNLTIKNGFAVPSYDDIVNLIKPLLSIPASYFNANHSEISDDIYNLQ